MIYKIYFIYRDFLYYIKYLKNFFFKKYYLNDQDFNIYHFYKSFGYKPNLKHPKTLNEKIIWLKIFKKNPDYKSFVDKLIVRNYIKTKIGKKHLIPLIAVYKNSSELDKNFIIKNLPLVIKTNHGSGDFSLLRTKHDINILKLKIFFRNALKRNLAFEKKQYQYDNIEKRIIVEKMLLNNDGSIPSDFKVHCFNGIPKFIYVTTGRGTSKIYRGVYDLDWNPLNLNWSRKINDNFEYKFNNNLIKPKNLDKIINLSKIISSDFSDTYVRVDFYNDNNFNIFFGEITFHHMSGFAPIEPASYDLNFGNMLNIK